MFGFAVIGAAFGIAGMAGIGNESGIWYGNWNGFIEFRDIDWERIDFDGWGWIF